LKLMEKKSSDDKKEKPDHLGKGQLYVEPITPIKEGGIFRIE